MSTAVDLISTQGDSARESWLARAESIGPAAPAPQHPTLASEALPDERALEPAAAVELTAPSAAPLPQSENSSPVTPPTTGGLPADNLQAPSNPVAQGPTSHT